MNLWDVLITWICEVIGVDDVSEDTLAPLLTNLSLIIESEQFEYVFRLNLNALYQLIPDYIELHT